MRRRRFIRDTFLALGTPLVLQGQTLGVIKENPFLKSLTASNPDRKLVLVQLDGGNDGLNTFIPLNQYGRLQSVRPNIVIPENEIIDFTDDIGLHPSMQEFKNLYENQHALIIQNTGYPNPNLSHFRSKDIVTSGSDANVVINSGWLGRNQHDLHPDFPTGYPNEQYPDPIAVTVGSSGSPTCQGYGNNLSVVIRNLNAQYQQTGEEPEEYPDTPYGHELNFITEAMKATEAYLEAVQGAANNAGNLSPYYPEKGENRLADSMAMVARLIAGGLKTQIYIVSLGGFDTHAKQVDNNDSTSGAHANLLKNVSQALWAFQDDMIRMKKDDEVLGFVYTEFGRRIKSNDSYGTDHGAAYPSILFGTMVNPTIMGTIEEIPNDVDPRKNLDFQYDFRSIYASIYKDWFEADDGTIRDILFKDFAYLPILKNSTNSNFFEKDPIQIEVFPNPAKSLIHIELFSNAKFGEIALYNSSGQLEKIFFSKKLNSTYNRMQFDLNGISKGIYFLRVRCDENSKINKLIITD